MPFSCCRPSQTAGWPPVSHLPLCQESYQNAKTAFSRSCTVTVWISHRSFIENNAKQARCKIVVCNTGVRSLILACLKLHAIVLTGAERDVGVEIATESEPITLCTLVEMTNQGAKQQLSECGLELLIELWFC